MLYWVWLGLASFLHLLNSLGCDTWVFSLLFFLFTPPSHLRGKWTSSCVSAWLLARVNPPQLEMRILFKINIFVNLFHLIHTTWLIYLLEIVKSRRQFATLRKDTHLFLSCILLQNCIHCLSWASKQEHRDEDWKVLWIWPVDLLPLKLPL